MQRIADTLKQLEAAGNLRTLPSGDGKECTDFSSNDYLGLAADTDLRDRFYDLAAARRPVPTSSASRLLATDQQPYARLEKLLENLYGRQALLFNSGYHANTGMIAALGGNDTLFIADKLVHASIIDGLKLSGSRYLRFRHNDWGHMSRLIKAHGAGAARVVIVAESVYSMDGDSADMQALHAARGLHPNVMLYVDEAHAVGVCGPAGLGLAQNMPVPPDIVMGTFGKALASEGAFALMSPALRQFMTNRCRSLIFSTAMSPLSAMWTTMTVQAAAGADTARAHLQNLAGQLHAQAGTPLASHIQPVIVGDAAKTVRLSAALAAQGLKVLPIRTPTVPPGTERLRISLSAAHTAGQIDMLARALNGTKHSLQPDFNRQ